MKSRRRGPSKDCLDLAVQGSPPLSLAFWGRLAGRQRSEKREASGAQGLCPGKRPAGWMGHPGGWRRGAYLALSGWASFRSRDKNWESYQRFRKFHTSLEPPQVDCCRSYCVPPGRSPETAARLPLSHIHSRWRSGLLGVGEGLVSWAGGAHCGPVSLYHQGELFIVTGI